MKLFVENNNNKYPVILGEDSDSTPIGYLDETTIEGVGNNKKLEQIMDYNNIRNWVLELVLAKDPDLAIAFGMCTADEQKICCEFQLMPYSVRVPNYFTDDEDKENWNKLVRITEGNPFGVLKGRTKIYQDLRVVVSDYVRREVWFPNNYRANISYAQDFYRDTYKIKEYYIAANDPEFGEFLRSDGRYTALTGFKCKDYWRQDLEDELLEVYNSY